MEESWQLLNCYTERSYFFKIFLEDAIKDKKLSIPRRFAKKYGSCLSNPVLFKVPSGAEWQVELLKGDGELSFQNGWTEFADCHSIDYGNFIVFKYEANSQFSVVIFNRSVTEINYPVSSLGCKKDEKNLRSQEGKQAIQGEDVFSVQFMDEVSPVSGSHSMPSKMKKTDSDGKAKRTTKSPDSVPLNGTRFINSNMDDHRKRRKET